MKKVVCLQCGTCFEISTDNVGKDAIGWHVEAGVCPGCGGSFDVELEDVVDLQEIIRHYHACLDPEYYRPFLEEFFVCYQIGADLIDIDGWIDLELSLGTRLDWAQYSAINGALCEHDIDTVGLCAELAHDPPLRKKVTKIAEKALPGLSLHGHDPELVALAAKYNE